MTLKNNESVRAVEGEAAAGAGQSTDSGSDQEESASYSIQNDQAAPPCSTCGAIMIRNGACYKCVNCGATSGCA